MKNTGIPTIYRGRQYRSRLEARWAAMFDLLGWPFEYEPFDFGGWIPDFLLTRANVLIEVKPAVSRPDDVAMELDNCPDADGREVLILGCSIPVVTCPTIYASDGIAVGWMRAEPMFWNKERGMARVWGYGIVQKFQLEVDGEVLASGYDLFSSRDHILYADPGFTFADDQLYRFASARGNSGPDLVMWGTGVSLDRESRETSPHVKILDLWARAGNLTQWRGKQSVVS